LGKIVATASDTTTSFEAATASVREKRPLADQVERAEQRSTILLAGHRMNGSTFTNTMKAWFNYQDWVHPDTNETRLVGSQTEAILYVFFNIPCFFSRAELELFLRVKALNHNVIGALRKMVQAQMIVMETDRNGTEQIYLEHFGMEALKQSTIPDINNRPNEYLESITLRNDNGYQMINDRRDARLKATKKRESPAKISTKVTPTQKENALLPKIHPEHPHRPPPHPHPQKTTKTTTQTKNLKTTVMITTTTTLTMTMTTMTTMTMTTTSTTATVTTAMTMTMTKITSYAS
jgi:hypothetical protein